MITSITAAYIFDSNNDFSDANGYDNVSNIVVSADYALAPGLMLAGDVAYFNLDINGSCTWWHRRHWLGRRGTLRGRVLSFGGNGDRCHSGAASGR